MKHEFAIFLENLSQLLQHKREFTVVDHATVHRLQQVLRLTQGDSVVFFDRYQQARCKLIALQKKQLTFVCDSISSHKPLQPQVHFLLPILERESFEEALYACSALGVTTITPVITQKSRKKWGSQKEQQRAQRILIAAAEQSKNFALPDLKTAQPLREAFKKAGAIKLFFDVGGAPALSVMNTMSKQLESLQDMQVWALVGPEGDLTEEEKLSTSQEGWEFCALTPTVLKASHAVMVGLGLLRSCLLDALDR